MTTTSILPSLISIVLMTIGGAIFAISLQLENKGPADKKSAFDNFLADWPPPADTLKKQEGLAIPAGVFDRLWYVYVMIIAPIVYFYLAGESKWGFAEWQDGRFATYVDITLGDLTTYFYPLISYPFLAALLLVIAPTFMSKRVLIRFGIYTGVFLAWQFTIQGMLSSIGFGVLMLGIPGAIGLAIVYWLSKKLWPRLRSALNIVVIARIVSVVFVLGGILLLFNNNDLGEIFFSIFGIVGLGLLLGPYFIVAPLGTWTAWRLWQQEEQPQMVHIGLGLMWLLVYALTWRIVVEKTLERYAALPPEPPNCYIATAAAQGHVRVVGSTRHETADGRPLIVNRQLQTLKAGELALLAFCPAVHRPLRRVYDIIGRRLARQISHPLTADLVYLSLKPFEWGTRLFFLTAGRPVRRLIGRMYT